MKLFCSTGKSVDCGATKWQTVYGYDAFGNITKTVPTGGTGDSFQPTYTSTSQPAATNRILTLPGSNPTYDALDNLTSVAQGPLNGRTFVYDSLSRLTQASNPESGTISYFYTTSSATLCSGKIGDVCRRADARGKTTTYSYDQLNRLTSKTYSDSTPAVTFIYDLSQKDGVTLTNPVGRLVYSSSGGNANQYTGYDSMGRVAQQWQCTPYNSGNSSWRFDYNYNLMGEMTSYLNGAMNWTTISQTFDGAGRVSQVTSNLVDANHPGTLFSTPVYDAPGLLTSGLLGNGITETRAYNPRLWLTSQTAGSVYSLTMSSYAPNGDILVTCSPKTGPKSDMILGHLRRQGNAKTEVHRSGDHRGSEAGRGRPHAD